MKHNYGISLLITAAAIALSSPHNAQASSMQSSQAATNAANASTGEDLSLQMVAARASLLNGLDAKKSKAGDPFQARLSRTVHLKNGQELPSGTMLAGTIESDNMQPSGKSSISLRFNSATLKDGKIVPIKATIMGVFAPESQDGEGFDIVTGDQASNIWKSGLQGVDQVDALSGVDLHSKVAGNNSGSFVSTKKHDVKLSAGTEIMLAVAALS